WRARNTILSPALIFPDTVHNRKATLSGSMRGAPERQLAELVLQRVAVAAERHAVAIRRFHSRAAVRGRTHMRGFRGWSFAADNAGKLPEKGQMLRAPPKIRLGPAVAQGTGNARRRHRLRRQIEACAQRRAQRRSARRDRRFTRRADLLHDALG